MKKLLLLTKTLLAVALLCVGQNAWASVINKVTLYPTGDIDPTSTDLWTGRANFLKVHHDGYISFTNNANSMSEGYIKFYDTGSDFYGDYASYTVSFDFWTYRGWAHASGTSTPQVAIYAEGATVGNNNSTFTARNTSKKNYLMLWSNTDVTLDARTMYVNGSTTENFTVAQSTWYTATITVTKSTGNVAYSIKPKSGGDALASGNYTATTDGTSYKCQGLYFSLGKYCQEVRIANIKVVANVEMSIADYVAINKGDLTGLINGDFEHGADGWTGGSCVTGLARGWSSSTDENPFYERSSNGALSYTLHDMPAGTYKVVAAARGYDGGKITPQIAGTTGATLNTVGDTRTAKSGSEINLNGVEMPYSELGGFTTNNNGHNWHWITATGTLAEAGDLVINFNCVGNSWMPIDDVHLYCTSLGGTSYTTTVTEGSAVSNSDGKVVTCDIVLANPNSIIKSNEAITTASGAALNNNLVGSNISNLVLYDGADNTFSMTAGDYTIGGATYYRSFTQDVYSTVCLPFTPNIAAGTYYEPTTLGDGYLTISEVADANLKPNTPYILKPSGNHTSLLNNNNAGNANKNKVVYSNNQPATEVDGGKMWFTGRLEKNEVEGSWSGDYYVLGTDSELHKISDTGTVTVNPFRAYLYVSGGSGARSALRLNVGDNVTGVENVEAAPAEAKEGKFVENGKLVIVKNGVKYNAAGAKLY